MGWYRFATVVCIALVLLTAIALCSSIGGWSYWPEGLTHFQLQYWIGALFLACLLLLLRQRTQLLIGLFCVALLSTNILTWYIPSMGKTTPLMKVMFSNVWINNRQYEDVLAQVRAEQPDIVGFTEIDAEWVVQLDQLRDILPHRTQHRHSTILYSKISLAGTEIIDLDQRFPETVIVRNLLHRGQRLTVVATHPPSPRSLENFERRNAHLENLAAYLAKLKDNLVVIGDFNTSPWSPYYRRLVTEARLLNASQGFGLYPTWLPARISQLAEPWRSLLSVPIDHVFTRSGNVKLRATNFHSLPDIGSDHLPIVAEIATVDP